MAERHRSAPQRTANFDRVARLYRWAEYLCYGPLLQRVRTAWMNELEDSRRVLVLGDGDGRFLARFVAHHRTAEVLAVDTSAAMLALLRGRCLARDPCAGGRLTIRQDSALAISPSGDIDLVISHFFLDCLSAPELAALSRALAERLQPGARWLVSDFALPHSPILRPVARVYLRGLYGVFQLLTGLRVSHLPPISETLAAAGFRRVLRREFAAGMLYSEMWQLGAAEDNISSENPAQARATRNCMQTDTQTRPPSSDPQPDPEPPVPSLPEPDPGVFHHDPADAPARPSSVPPSRSGSASA